MASPFRTCSPSAANRPNKANSNNGLRKSFNVNVLPKATASRNGNQAPSFTPANSPADYPQRTSPFKDFNAPAWQSEEIGLENVRQCPPKSASAKSPAPKGMKNFMSPTFSAASKAASSKKRILVERNESTGLSQIPAKEPSDFANPHIMNLPASREPMMEDTYMKENEEAPRDIMEVGFVRSVTLPENQTKKDVRRVLYQVPVSSTDNDSLSFLSQFPDPGEERTTHLPPYDPKRNYLSPRPDFLRYRPNRGLDIDIMEDEGFGKREFFNYETPETGVAETKEIESLGKRMDAVGISSEDLDHRETHKESQVKLVSVRNSEQNESETPPESGVTETKSSEGLDHREIQKELQVKLVSVGNSDYNKSEIPPESGVTETKENESLAERMDTSSISSEDLDHAETHEDLQVKLASVGNPEQNPWNHGLEFDSKKNATVEVEEKEDDSDDEDEEEEKQGSRWLRTFLLFGFVLLVSSVALLSSGSPGLLPPSLHNNVLARGEFYDSAADIVKNLVVVWRGDSVKSAGYSVLGYSRMKYGVIEKTVKSWFDSSSNKLGMRTQSSMEDGLQISFEDSCTGDVEESGRSLHMGIDEEDDINSVDSVGREDLKEKQSSTKAVLEALDAILVKDVSQIPSVDASIQQNGQVNTDDDVLHKNPDLPLPSDLLDEDSVEEVHGSGDYVVSSPSSLEARAYPEEPFSFYPDIQEAKHAVGGIEDSWSEVQSEEAQNVVGHASKEHGIPEVPEIIQISEPVEILSLNIVEDLQISGDDVLNKQSRPSMVPSDEHQTHHASQLEKIDKSFAEDIESKKSNEPKESSLTAAEDSKGSEVQTSEIPRRNPRGLLPTGTRAVLSILVASVIAATYLVYASRKRSKIPREVVADKPTVEFFAKKESEKEIRPTLERMERTYSPVHFPSSRNYPHVQLLAEYHPEEVSSSDKSMSRINTPEKSVQMYERRFRKGNIFSSDTQQDSAVTSEISPDSLSYGSFTTYEKIARKEGGGVRDPKVITPVRRSSRIRKQATSP
ncbi:hypothetical protein SUGI_0602300 [Cryptomeria japonica]|uniref:uncharacterized protein LOC131071811 n=1 Tax=Cryptomeria japonica TaxID=3369 RepID=UPI002414C0D3|nr:uncharacterized protein LOC131071811 [Cryptomeria japonica]GLJ30431.1 hypothetical protein SUGI_0602300 [Cryptomeria japonica]